MKAKFAKALAENITEIAGNVAHVALIDRGVVNDEVIPPLRSEACTKIENCKRNIAALLQQPGTWASEDPGSTAPTAKGSDLERWDKIQTQNQQLRRLLDEAAFAFQQLRAMPDLQERIHRALHTKIP